MVAGYFHLAAADIECKLKKAPQIHVVASDTNVEYDHTKNQAALDKMGTDTVSPYGKGVTTHVGGLMAGEVSISQNIRILTETFPSLNAGCLYIDSLKVEIHIDPKIFIAREFPKTGCMYSAVMEHEKKHIRADRLIVNKYTTVIIDALDAALKKAGYAYGPYSAGEISAAQKEIQKFTQGIVRAYSAKMNAERKKMQQDIDTLQEYQRVNNMCKGKK